MDVHVCSASVHDPVATREILEGLTTENQPRWEAIWADSKYHNHQLNDWIANKDDIAWRLEIVRWPQEANGFVLLPKRWVVERTFSWLGRWRRLSHDDEHLSTSSEAMVKVASIGRMRRRLEET
jgi:putative transposase